MRSIFESYDDKERLDKLWEEIYHADPKSWCYDVHHTALRDQVKELSDKLSQLMEFLEVEQHTEPPKTFIRKKSKAEDKES